MSIHSLAGILAAAVLSFGGSAAAGDISGIVKYRSSGSPASGVRMSGLAAGAFGGVTKAVYTDDRGKFVLSYSSRGGLAKLYANGSVVATDIRDGEYVVVTIK